MVVLAAAILPLAFTTGRNFEYEYTVLCSWLLVIGLWLRGALADRLSPPPGWRAFLLSLVLLPLPAIAAFTAGVCPCSSGGYTFWATINILPAYLIGWAGRLWLHPLHRRRGLLTAALILGGSALAVASDLWLEAPKRATSLMWGFLHGPIYDRWIPVDGGILWQRLGHALIGAGAIATWATQGHVRRTILIVSFAAWTFSGLQASRYPSAITRTAELAERLPMITSAPGYRIHGLGSPSPQRQQQLIAEAAFHWQEIGALIPPADRPHVTIFVYPDDEAKKLWFGGGNTDVTDVVTPSIHITWDRFPHPTLRHELVHALASGSAFFGLGFHPNLAFTEGLAVALAPEERTLDLDAAASSILSQGRIASVSSLFSPLFWKESGHRAYTVAGALLRYMVDRYGLETVLALYRGASAEEVAGTSWEQIASDWQQHAATRYDEKRHGLLGERLFRAEGQLHQLCPHSKEDLHPYRAGSAFVRWRQPPGWDAERGYDHWRRSLAPHDRGLAWQQWKRAIHERWRAGERDLPPAAQAFITEHANEPFATLEDVEMALIRADDAAMRGDWADYRQRIDALETLRQQQQWGDSLSRQINARFALAQELPDAALRPWAHYLVGAGPLPTDSPSAMGQYLRFRRQGATNDEMAGWMRASGAPLSEVAPVIAREWVRLIAARAAKRQAYALAAEAWTRAATLPPPGSHKLYAQHARLQAWLGGDGS